MHRRTVRSPLQLYGGDLTYRLKQEIVLGLGGVRMLHEIGFEIKKYHMNEGHASFSDP